MSSRHTFSTHTLTLTLHLSLLIYTKSPQATHSHALKKTNNQESKRFSLKNKEDLGVTCYTPPFQKAKKQGEMPLPNLSPIPCHFLILHFLNVVLQLCLASMIAAETNFWKFLHTLLQGSNIALILLMEWNHELCILQFIGSSKIPEEVHIHSTFLCWKQSAEWASHEVVRSLVPHFCTESDQRKEAGLQDYWFPLISIPLQTLLNHEGWVRLRMLIWQWCTTILKLEW